MKKILNLSLILFIFCLTFTFGGIFTTYTASADGATSKPPVEIGSAVDLQNYLISYGGVATTDGKPDDNIILTADINLNGIDLDGKTIGTEQNPFVGTFDGNGYTISNFSIDTSIDISTTDPVTNQYAGLFGYTKGATLKNVAFAGNTSIVTGGYNAVPTDTGSGAINIYAGLLVGKAENTTISMIQNTSNLTFNPSFDSNIFFGSIAGMASSSSKFSEINTFSSKVISNWNLSSPDGKVHNIGGVAGYLSSSHISFSLVSQSFNTTVGSDFIGSFNLGGIVGRITDGGSIINVGVENSYSLTNNATSADAVVNLGEVAGLVATPAPTSGNISYIHYADNGVQIFGDKKNYSFSGSKHETDYITKSTYSLKSVEINSQIVNYVPHYFDSQAWNETISGSWDFDTIWYANNARASLQAFAGDYLIQYINSNDSALECKTTLESSYRYGQKVTLEFAFKESMSNFYDIASISLDGKKFATVDTISNGDDKYYRVSDNDYLEISPLETADVDGFKLTIKQVNRMTAGEYSITTSDIIFSGHITSRLYDSEEATTPIEGELPGYVYFAEGANTTTESITLSQITYGNTYALKTEEKPSTPNAFAGWYMVNDEGDDIAISTDNVLRITFGTGHFVGNFELYAKYLDNAQVVYFIFDEGITKIDLYSGSVSITDSNTPVSISKENSNLKLEIYVEEGKVLNTALFVDTLNTYKSDEAGKDFCTMNTRSVEDIEFNRYSFALDMTVLNKIDFSEKFEIKAQTQSDEKNDNSMMWIIIGCSCGGVVLIALIVLIIILVKRRNGGFGGGSYKKSFKKSYY